MLYSLLVSIFVVICILLVLLILIQQAKGSMGLGAIGGSSQMLFGGSGGQDILQKTTWVLATLFVGMSLTLSLMRSTAHTSGRYINVRPTQQSAPAQPAS